MEGKITMTELKTCITINEILEINALLDMEQDIRNCNMEKENAKIKDKQ